MTIAILGVVGFVIFGGFIFLIHQALANEKHQGELEKEIEDTRHYNKLQKTYADIASRPGYDYRALIARMRGKPPANK
jgi:ribosomal protein L20A (L18A)